jgi:hypothetical protein
MKRIAPALPYLLLFALLTGATLTYRSLMVDVGNQCNQAVTFLQQVKVSNDYQLQVNGITTYTAVAGVSIDPSLLVDTINEYTTDNGVDIESVHMEDNVVTATTFVGAFAGYGTLYIDAASCMPAATAGATATFTETTTNKVNYDRLAFAGAAGGADNHAWFKARLPEDWNLGTVKAKIAWEPAAGASAADYVGWEISGVAISNDDTLDAATGTTVTVADQVTAVGDLHVTAASNDITIGGTPAAGDYVFFKISRNYDYTGGGTALAETAYLLGVEIQYTKSTTAPAGW